MLYLIDETNREKYINIHLIYRRWIYMFVTCDSIWNFKSWNSTQNKNIILNCVNFERIKCDRNTEFEQNDWWTRIIFDSEISDVKCLNEMNNWLMNTKLQRLNQIFI